MAHCVWKVPLGSGNHVVGELFIRSRSKRDVFFDRVKNEYSRESSRLVLQFNTTHVDFIDLKWPNIDTPSVARGKTFQVILRPGKFHRNFPNWPEFILYRFIFLWMYRMNLTFIPHNESSHQNQDNSKWRSSSWFSINDSKIRNISIFKKKQEISKRGNRPTITVWLQ